MGAHKRKSSAPGPRAAEAKRARGAEGEFTGTQFKSLLRDPETAIKGLENFVSTAKTLPSTELYDVVEGYIKISVECAEIFRLLDGERRPESEMLLIFQALEAILLRTASDLSHFSVVGMNIVKKLINSYMKLIYAALYSESHRMTRVCLTLLSAMVAQGPDSARDVYSHFDFNNKFLPGLVKKRDKKGKPDVRMAYIQFALSFLIAGDNTILVQVLELKDFIPDILRTGLKEDKVSTINLLFSTLGTKVVQNKSISKTQKVRFFTVEVLSHIASLYRWNGITDVSTEDVKITQDPEEAGKVMVRELVHNFLMDLCCSLKHGINFYDRSLGTSGRGGNLVLLRFLLNLKTATEDEMVADLMVNILKVCPDLLNKYFKETQYSFIPRLKSTWLDNIKLLKKIYEAQPEISTSFKTAEFIPLPRLLSMVMVTTVPVVCNKTMFTQGLTLPSKTVKHTILTLISTILRRALKNIEHCLNEEIWQKSEIYTPLMMQEFVQLYREALSKLLPDMNSIVAVWQSLLKQEREQHDGERREDTISTEEEMTEITETNEQHGSDDAETTLLKAVLLQVICLCQKVVPHLVAQSNFDFSKLLKGIVTEKGLREEIPPVLQHHILKVALELPANKFAWFRVQDVSETEKVRGERSVFYLLMKMFVTSNHSQLKTSTKQLIIKVLHDSGVFEYTWKELVLWLEHLDNTIEDKKEAVIQFLERILMKLVTNPYPYTDKAADLVQEASMLLVNLFKQDVDNVSIPISHIDDVLDMVDVLVEGSEGLDEEIGFSLNEDMILHTFPFSAVVPAALEARNKLLLQTENEMGGSIVEYLVAVFTDLLHSQRDPLALCLMFQLFDKELQSLNASQYPQLYQFNQYYSLWIPQQAKETLLKQTECISRELILPPDSSFPSLLKIAFERGGAVLLEDGVQAKLREAASQLQLQQLLLAVRHVLLYLKTTVENFGSLSKSSGPRLLGLYMDLLSSLLCRCDQMKLCNEQKQEGAQTESDLFMDLESVATMESADGKILEDMLMLIFKHPTLETWFLALEQHSLPQHNLNPVMVKLLSAHVNNGILQLLKVSAPMLQNMKHIDMLSKYFEAITESVLEELRAGRKEKNLVSPKKSQQLEALQQLHVYMDAAQLKEVTLTMLQLPEASLTTQKSENSPKKERNLSFYGKTLVQLLTESYQRQTIQGELLLSTEHIKGMGTLLSTSNSEDLEKVFLNALSREPLFAHAVGVDVHVYCLNHMTETSLAIVALLIQHCRTHLLQFELWCLNCATGKYLRKNMDIFLPLINVYLQSREQYDFTRPSKVSSAVVPVLKVALWKELSKKILDTEPSQELTAVKLQVFSKLVQSSEIEALTNLIDQLPGTLERAENYESWIVADSISRALENSAEDLHSWKKSLLAACIKWLITTYNISKDQENNQGTESSMLLRLEELLMEVNVKNCIAICSLSLLLLEMLTSFLSTECVVACHAFVEVNALGLTVAALSSYDSNMRAAAYYILGSFRSHLEGARFREQRQLLYLMDVVQNGIRQPNLRFTFSLTLFVARVMQQMLKPEEHMYTKINKFLLSHQYLDLKKVPGFYQLFYSFDLEHKTEREWVLGLLGEGLRDKHCYELYNYQRIFHVILCFFNSPLCDEASQSHILEILQNAARITKAAYELIRDHSLLTWILYILEKRFLENKVLTSVISLVHTLWITNLGNKGRAMPLQTLCKKEPQENQKFLPLQLINEFLYVLIMLVKHIRTNLDFATLTQFFSTFSSVLGYRATVVEAFRQMGRFTVNESVLSNKDVLMLLHKWGIIERNLQLQEDVQTTAEKYQVKELLKNIKEKNKGQVPFRPSSRHVRKKDVVEREEETDSELKVSNLEKCRDHLESILVHWEPVYPAPFAKLPEEQLESTDPENETISLTCATAYIVTKWLVKSMVDHSLNIQNVFLTLKWLNSSILPHPPVVREILRDATLKSSVFKLYNRICEANEEKSSNIEELCLFNTIMLHFLDAQELTNASCHKVVKTFCLSAMKEKDEIKKASCVFLASVYIGDIWLGAQEPDMFISHVKLICGGTDGKLNGDDKKMHKQAEEAMVSLCKDIYLAILGH
ncbi:nucleolar pre-ribosomal-associated protein 1 [Trachemys scripta elegans]|uniref:nucleolar pre-ribosomal-associated protein 1 n=1 Tax=Trachemys scripta elegans TaxID=31138 RepID=UPI0015533C39|nr:nucleolar pre-ribosomal-associated protein 1 [Trachemys scripta elegans]